MWRDRGPFPYNAGPMRIAVRLALASLVVTFGMVAYCVHLHVQLARGETPSVGFSLAQSRTEDLYDCADFDTQA